VVRTLTFECLFAFLVIGHGRRQLLWFAVTRHPTAEWLAQQIVEAFPWDMDLLAEANLEAQHVGRGLCPERISGTGAGQSRHHQAIDLVFGDASLVEQILKNLAGQYPDVAGAFLHHLSFGVSHDGVVTQTHRSLPLNN
jgi:hypothetical protein